MQPGPLAAPYGALQHRQRRKIRGSNPGAVTRSYGLASRPITTLAIFQAADGRVERHSVTYDPFSRRSPLPECEFICPF